MKPSITYCVLLLLFWFDFKLKEEQAKHHQDVIERHKKRIKELEEEENSKWMMQLKDKKIGSSANIAW